MKLTFSLDCLSQFSGKRSIVPWFYSDLDIPRRKTQFNTPLFYARGLLACNDGDEEDRCSPGNGRNPDRGVNLGQIPMEAELMTSARSLFGHPWSSSVLMGRENRWTGLLSLTCVTIYRFIHIDCPQLDVQRMVPYGVACMGRIKLSCKVISPPLGEQMTGTGISVDEPKFRFNLETLDMHYRHIITSSGRLLLWLMLVSRYGASRTVSDQLHA